jgi:hypothetical protein
MMAKHPADRFQTAAEVAEALAPYVAGASHSMILLRQTMHFHAGQLAMRAPNRRKRLLVLAGGAIAAACCVGLLILAWPSIFPGGAYGLQDHSRAETNEPGSNTLESAKPMVITIENGLTVAKDGTGQFTTINEALQKVTPGQTIRVLDKAVYKEQVAIEKRGRMEGITLESPLGATVMMPPSVTIGVFVHNVPRVTVRGFALRSDNPFSFLCIVGGKSSGSIIEGLDIRLDGSSCIGLSIEQLDLSKEDAPITVRNCVFAGLHRGLRVSGVSNDGKPNPSRRVMLRDNDVSDSPVGIGVGGLVSDVYIVGNRVWNCTIATMQIEDLFQGSSNLLIANNSLQNDRSCILIQELSAATERIAIRNNLLLARPGLDMQFLGKDRQFLAACQLDHNWREMRPPGRGTSEEKIWIPPGPQDVLKEQVLGVAHDPADAKNFLRPAKDSLLATAGVGGDLPTYVGAVPPDGVERWDWDKTWIARTSNSSKEKKTGKD